MSDYEDDEMDVDRPQEQEEITFSSRAEDKGKRSAANLPIEAADSLPWVEKYRPATLDEVSGHKDILATINRFLEANRLPHLLLYGPPGTGKTSTVLALARKIYGTKNMRQMVLELNASDDRGIDVVREQIKTFSSTKQIFNSFAPTANTTSNGTTSSLATFKLIILDEADSMTSTAQMALRRIMEKYTPNTRFCIICNYAHKLSPALLSRCTRFRFSPLPAPAIRSLVDRVIAQEHVNIHDEATEALVKLSKGDMRRALNVLQACHASTRPMPDGERADSEQADAQADSHPSDGGALITSETIYTCIAAPHPSTITQIRDLLLSTSDVRSVLQQLALLKTGQGLALADVLTALAEELGQSLEVPPQTRVAWLEGLSDVEYRLSGGGAEKVQMGAMVGVVRGGVELMDKRT